MTKIKVSVNTTRQDFANSKKNVKKDMKTKFVKPSLSAPMESAKKGIQKCAETSLQRESAVTMKNVHILINNQTTYN